MNHPTRNTMPWRFCAVAVAAALALGLSACQKADDSAATAPVPPNNVATAPATTPSTAPAAVTPAPTTPGEKLDNAIARTEQAADNAKASASESTAEARADASAAASRAGEALKEAGADAKSALQSAGTALGHAMDDASLTAMVKTQLARDPDISALRIDVDTKDGAVTLNGSAPTAAAKTRAEDIAKAVQGVKSVSNRLEVKAS